ncbi:MAG: nitrogen regulation protein NR(I) [Gammaproteobacteria bacterium]
MMRDTNVWVIDDDQAMRWVLERAFQKAEIPVTTFESATIAMRELEQQTPSAILTDVRMPGIDGFEFLEQIKTSHPSLPIIIMTAHSDLQSAVGAYQKGAFEYLPKPFDVDEAVELTKRACLAVTEEGNTGIEKESLFAQELPKIIGESPAMQEVFRAIGRLSNSNITVLINGASGSGKELVAHALHEHSPRAHGSFIALNMAAIPRDLLESELFGHEKGAFTGAQTLRKGRFEQAHQGTLFLDEIGDMPADLQTRLLRVLSDGHFYRVGGHDSIKADVRIIAATHQNLEARVKKGEFREDLFHRLNVIRIHIPMLSERKEDIPILLKHFMKNSAQELETVPKKLSSEVLEYLSALKWPGNVRQLENVCRWLTVMASSNEIRMQDLPAEMLKNEMSTEETADWQSLLSEWADRELSKGEKGILDQATPLFEAIMIKAAMRRTGGKRQEAAKLLGWGRNTLTRKIQELGLFQS